MRGFTLIELMVVIAIMGLLGTVSVGGYRQMQRGMEERGVMENVNSFMRAAYERAQIDRRPTYVYFWNELVRKEGETSDETEIIVGHAVAVRGHGRISRSDSGKGLLIDEFGDLEQFKIKNNEEEYSEETDNGSNDGTIRLYQLDGTDEMKYSVVYETPQRAGSQQILYSSNADDPSKKSLPSDVDEGIVSFGYKKTGADKNVSWQNGSVYGLEFQSLELPHGYIFKTEVPSDLSNPIKEVGGIVCTVGQGQNKGKADTIEVYARRQGRDGSMGSQRVGTSTNPTQNL